MVLLVTVLSMIIIAQAVVLYRLLRELRNAHLNLAAEVGVVRRDCIAAMTRHHEDIVESFRQEIAGARRDTVSYLDTSIEPISAYAKSLNERLVLLEIEKTAAPKPPDEPPPSRRSYASQKARAEAGARK